MFQELKNKKVLFITTKKFRLFEKYPGTSALAGTGSSGIRNWR